MQVTETLDLEMTMRTCIVICFGLGCILITYILQASNELHVES